MVSKIVGGLIALLLRDWLLASQTGAVRFRLFISGG